MRSALFWQAATFLAALLLVGRLFAQGDQAHQLYLGGDYLGAYQAAVASETASAQLLASRAAADQASYLLRDAPARERLDWLQLAVAAAEASLALDPQQPDALLAYARARGEIALLTSVLRNLDIASELRRAIEGALELQPEHPDALVALGMWHLELVERGVGWLYGGRRDAILPLVERGVAVAPDRINLRVEYAKALRALGHGQLAAEQLAIAIALPAASASDRHEQDRARAMQD